MKVEELEIPPSPIHDTDYEIPNPPIQDTDYEIPNPPIHDSEFVSCEILPDLPDNSYENPLETGYKVNQKNEADDFCLKPLMQHGHQNSIQNPKDKKPFLLGKNITITKSKANDAKVKKMIFKKKVIGYQSEKKILLPDMIATNLAKNRGLKQNIKKESQKYEILPNLMQRQIHQQNSVQKIKTKPIFLGDNITITKSVPYKTGNLKNLLKPVKKATKNTRTESPKREILTDLPENSLRNSFETHDNDPLMQKPNHKKASLIGNNIIVMKSESDTKVNLNQFENNSLMPVKKTSTEVQPRKIGPKSEFGSKRKLGPKSVIESPTINAKTDCVNQNVEKESPKYERKGNLVVIKLTPKNSGKSFESPENKDPKSPPNSGEVHEATKKQFKCDICNANFSQKPSLSRHIANFHRYELIKKHMKCKECDLSFNTNFHLNKHFASVHQGNISNALPNFKEVHESRMQFKCGPQGNKWWGFKCSDCTAAFKSKQNLNAHIQSVHEGKKSIQSVHEGKKPFIPSTKESKIAVESNLVMNIPSFYGVNISKSSLNKNTSSVHENKKPFKCNECGTGFRVKKTLDRHIKTVHEGKDTPKFKIPCTTDPQISNKGQIQNQVSSVHDGKKSLKSNPVKKNELDNNIKKVHDGKKPFGCNSCGKSFGSEKNVTMHINVVHGGKITNGHITNQIPTVHDGKRPSDGKKPHKCSICSFTCSSKQYLQNHIMKKHGLTAHERKNLFHSVIKSNDSLQKQTSDPLPFDCNSCWSRFASKPDLDQHNISAHQNKKQFKCNPCKVGFTSKQALNQHISSTHQGKKLTEQWKNQIASLLTSED